MIDKIVRVAVYARVSTQEQAVEGTSLEHQSEQLESYCKSQGWEIIQSYIDPGYSGKDDNRPGLKRLLADAKLNLFSKVVVYKMDRLARNLRLLLDIQDKLEKCGVPFHSVSEVLDSSTTSGRHFLQMLGMIGEWERETIIERTKAGKLQRYKEGCWAGGKAPYGYDYNRDTKKLIINKTEAGIVRRIFQEYCTGKSMSYIANMLNGDKVLPRWSSGKGWRATAVRNILINPLYKGTQIVNRHMHISDIAKVDMSTAIIISVPAIVKAKDWQLAQQHLIDNKRIRPVREDKWLLQGMVTCGECGLSFKSEGHPKHRYYSCRGRLKQNHVDGSAKCTSPRLKADCLENKVWKRIKEISEDPNKLKPLLEEAIDSLKSREEEFKVRILPIDDRLSQIAEQKSRLANGFVMLNMNAAKYQELQKSLDVEEARLKGIRNEIDPAQLEELERTREELRSLEEELQKMAWNTEKEDGRMDRSVNSPHKVFQQLVISKYTPREWLEKLQMRLMVYHDRIEIKAVFRLDPIYYQECTST